MEEPTPTTLLGKHLILDSCGNVAHNFEARPEEFKSACEVAKQLVIDKGGEMYVATVVRKYQQIISAKEESI